MKTYFADLHIHIGCTSENKRVKVTASRNLTFENIIKECLLRKGLDIIGIVDCASPGVLNDIKTLIKKGQLLELPEGGLLHKDKVTVLLASEIETCEIQGGVSHHLAFFPFLKQITLFSKHMSKYISNIYLSSQRCFLPAQKLLQIVKWHGGVLIPAHAFTPHKSVYGRVCSRLSEIFPPDEIFAIELGLSADTFLADYLSELERVSFLSNSDAHSLAKIAREYNLLELEKPNFKEVILALHRQGGRYIKANFGLNPRLGKYHRSFCQVCNFIATVPSSVDSCSQCGRKDSGFTKGVLDRIIEIKDKSQSISSPDRPPYHYQIPLEFTPGVTSDVLDHLISCFKSEMAVLHKIDRKNLVKAVGWEIANNIILTREGKLKLAAGGGGHYGKVKGVQPKDEQMTLFKEATV